MNTERLKEIIAYIKANPETHDQNTWTNIPGNMPRVKKPGEVTINCGTTGCLAGHGAFRYAPEYTIFYHETLQVPHGELQYYDDYGKEIFGLDHFEGCYLFDEDTTIEEMEQFISDPAVYREVKKWHDRNCACT